MRLPLVALSIAGLTACFCGDDGQDADDFGDSDGDWAWDDDDVGGSEDAWEFDQDLDAVLVQVANGSIAVDSTGGDTVRVEWDGGGFGDAASPEVWIEDGLLYVDADGGVTGGGDITVWLPEGMGIGAWINYGEIDIDLDAPSDIVACADAGDIQIDVPSGRWDLDLDTPVGDTRVDNVQDDPDSPWHIRSRIAAGTLQITGH